METSFRVIKVYSDRCFMAVYDTDDFKEALIARDAADNASHGERHIIIAFPPEDSGSEYDAVIKALRMESR
jgi:hypothetical protein